jgi:hypothetical protein
MSRDQADTVTRVERPDLLPVVVPPAGLPVPHEEIRCSVCERPLLRTARDGRSRAIMVKCRHCGALQHRHL